MVGASESFLRPSKTAWADNRVARKGKKERRGNPRIHRTKSLRLIIKDSCHLLRPVLLAHQFFGLLPSVVNFFTFRLQEPVVAIRAVELYILVSQVSEVHLEFFFALWTHDRKYSDHGLALLTINDKFGFLS